MRARTLQSFTEHDYLEIGPLLVMSDGLAEVFEIASVHPPEEET